MILNKLNPNGAVQAVFQMADQNGEENFPFELHVSSGVSFERLEGEAREASLQRGGDGWAAQLEDGYLSLNTYRARQLRPKGNAFTLYIRALIDPDDQGCLFYSDFMSLSVHANGLAVAFLGVHTKGGINYREIPLARMTRGQWTDLIFQVDEGEMRFYDNGVLSAAYPLQQALGIPFDDDMVIGGFRCLKPDSYFTAEPTHRFRHCMIDTLAVWDCALPESVLAKLCGVEALKKADENTPERRMFNAYNRFYDASVEGDVERCAQEWRVMTAIGAQDPTRPAYHLTMPVGHIFDPVGAYYYDGKYHVYSYHNLCYRLDYCSLDHYVTEDLLHWYGYPIGPFADTEHDVFSIFLLNHFVDDEGNPRVLYTGHGFKGKCGVLARPDKHLITYTDKHAVLTRYHHDGHVFKREGTWYTITSKLCKGKRPGLLGDPLMLWSSPDLEHWTEESEIFCGQKTSFDPEGFLEFPYLLNYGEKDVLIAGVRPVQYWVGRMDWEQKRFLPDCEEGRRIDYTNAFPCFNPQCVDQLGENGADRRILMVLYRDIGCQPSAGIPWYGTHAQPRLLTFRDERICQEPLPEIEKLRETHTDLGTYALRSNTVQTVGTVGNCVEIRAVFNCPQSGRVGIHFGAVNQTIRVTYDADKDEICLDGTAHPTGGGPAYLTGEKRLEMRIFIDRMLIEVFVNGVSMTTTSMEPLSQDTALTLFGEGLKHSCACTAECWTLRATHV